LLGSMADFAGTCTLGETQMVDHIDISWNQGWKGTNPARFFERDGNERRSILAWHKLADARTYPRTMGSGHTL
jgi:hypothetical protein